jgi:hypothetical protein
VTGGSPKPVVALDDVLSGQHPDIIKTDTDGFEIQVLRGTDQCLRNAGPHVFVEFSPFFLKEYGKSEPVELFGILEQRGYVSALFYDHTGYVMGLFDLKQKELAMILKYIASKPTFHADILFSKDDDMLRKFHELEIARMPVRTSY